MTGIDFTSETMDFSNMSKEEKENYMEKLIEKQLNLSKFMASMYGTELTNDLFVLMDAVKKKGIAKVLSDRLHRKMLFSNFSRIFISVIDELFY